MTSEPQPNAPSATVDVGIIVCVGMVFLALVVLYALAFILMSGPEDTRNGDDL